MTMTELSASSSFSELCSQDDPSFLHALRTTIFPGELPADSNCLKRRRSEVIEEVTRLSQEHVRTKSQSYTSCEDEYGSAGEDGQRKRKKISEEPQEPQFIQGSSLAPVSPFKASETERDCHEDRFLPHSEANHTPLHVSDPVSYADAARVSGYSPHKANEHVERLMQDADFRAEHTSAAGADFIDGFYKNSRLHHLSTWKVELRALVAEAQERAEKAFIRGTEDDSEEGTGADENEGGKDGEVNEIVGKVEADSGTSMRGNVFQLLRSPRKGKGKSNDRDSADPETIIMHCDFDCFFASVGLLTRPYLKDQPVVVCHSQGAQGRETSTSEVSSANYKARDHGVRNGMRCIYNFSKCLLL